MALQALPAFTWLHDAQQTQTEGQLLREDVKYNHLLPYRHLLYLQTAVRLQLCQRRSTSREHIHS